MKTTSYKSLEPYGHFCYASYTCRPIWVINMGSYTSVSNHDLHILNQKSLKGEANNTI
jgi:hypothetical protein